MAAYRLSKLYVEQEQFVKAEALLHAAIKLNHTANKSLDSIFPYVYNNLASVYLLQGEYEKTILTLNKAIEFSAKIPSQKFTVFFLISNVWISMPDMYQPSGYQKGIYYLEQLEPLARQMNNISYLALILNNEGHAYMKLKNWSKCEEKLTLSINLSRKNRLPVLPLALITMGEACYGQNNFRKALVYLDEANHLKSDAATYVYGIVMLARTYMALNNYGNASSLLNEAESIAEKSNLNSLLIEIYKQQSDLMTYRKNYPEALQYYKKFRMMQDSFMGKEVAKGIQQLDLKYKTSEAHRKLLERQLFIRKQGQLLQKKNSQIALLIFVIVTSGIIVFAIYNRNRNKKKLLLQTTRMDLLKATISGEEKERNRIAQELHDGIGGMLAVINMNFLSAKKAGFKDGEQTDKISQMILNTSAEVRKTAHNLLPTALEQHDLIKAIEILCSEISNSGSHMIDLEINEGLTQIDVTFNIAIYRIIQELLQNIIKHSDASHIVIIMEKEAEEINISVEDNGKGFNIEDIESEGLGMDSIRRRVSSLGGTVRIKSEVGIGTSINLAFKHLT